MAKELDIKYKTVLDNIKSSIQLSEELKIYLDSEEDEDYKALVAKFESEIHELYSQVANVNPLQLESFESYLLDEQFEGLYLPKALGYAVLRGRVNENIKYYRPQNHFAKFLDFIIGSSNFEQIKQRVGQSIKIGFALSSDIWITNILAAVSNKRAKAFLESQKSNELRELKLRNTALVKYRKQFQSLNFSTAKFPTNKAELIAEAGSLKNFMIFRGLSDHDNENLKPTINEFLANSEFYDSKDFYELCLITGLHFNLDDQGIRILKQAMSDMRVKEDKDSYHVFEILNFHSDKISGIDIDSEKRLSKAIDRSVQDEISAYYNMLDSVNSLGYVHPDASNAIRDYYYQNEGLSQENEAIRKSILSKLRSFLKNLSVEEYNEYFEINKIFTEYMDIFSNQKFNQDLKDLSLSYVKSCLKHYKDKRSKEYQDIKKFVKTTFVDYGFMTEKQVTELFKTKRKPKTTA